MTPFYYRGEWGCWYCASYQHNRMIVGLGWTQDEALKAWQESVKRINN